MLHVQLIFKLNNNIKILNRGDVWIVIWKSKIVR